MAKLKKLISKEEQALLQSIWEEPHEDLPRLVFADWLEESGEETAQNWAEYIRLDCEYHRVKYLSELLLSNVQQGLHQIRRFHGNSLFQFLPQEYREKSTYKGYPLINTSKNMEQLMEMTAYKLNQFPLFHFDCHLNIRNAKMLLKWPGLSKTNYLSVDFEDMQNADLFMSGYDYRNISSLVLSGLENESNINSFSKMKLRYLETLKIVMRPGDEIGLYISDNSPFAAAKILHISEDLHRGLEEGSKKMRFEKLSLCKSFQSLVKLNCDCAISVEELELLLDWSAISTCRTISLVVVARKAKLSPCKLIAESKNCSNVQRLSLNFDRLSQEDLSEIANSANLKSLKHLTVFSPEKNVDISILRKLNDRSITLSLYPRA